MDTEVINIARKMLGQGDLEEALDYLLEKDKTNSELLMLGSQLKEWNKQNLLGLKSDNTEKNRIRWATINMLTNFQLNGNAKNPDNQELLVLSDIIEENILSINKELTRQNSLDLKSFKNIEWLSSSYPKEYLYLISRISEYYAIISKERRLISKVKSIEKEFNISYSEVNQNNLCINTYLQVAESLFQFTVYKSLKKKLILIVNSKWAKFLRTEFKRKQIEIIHTVDIIDKKKAEDILKSFVIMPEKFLFWREIIETFEKRIRVLNIALGKLERRHHFVNNILTGGASAVLTHNYSSVQQEIHNVNTIVTDLKESFSSIPNIDNKDSLPNIDLFQYEDGSNNFLPEDLSEVNTLEVSELELDAIDIPDVSEIDLSLINDAIEIIYDFHG
jgi:hypothetical protein